MLGWADVLQLAKVAGASTTPPVAAVQPMGRPRNSHLPRYSSMMIGDARRRSPLRLLEGSTGHSMGATGLQAALNGGAPLVEVTVEFQDQVDAVAATARVNAKFDDFDLYTRPWCDQPRLRVGSATAELWSGCLGGVSSVCSWSGTMK